MKKIVPSLYIFGRNQKKLEELAQEFDSLRTEFINLQIHTCDMTQLASFDHSAQLVMIDLEEWIPSDELVLSELRDNGYAGPIIVLTKKITESAGADYAKDRIVFFDRSRGARELFGITRRNLLGTLIAARKHPRHPTNEKAHVQIEGSQAVLSCKVVNISKGGALLQFDKAVSLRIGDHLLVKIKLTQLNRLYSVRARVAWVKLPTFGVEFLGEAV